MLERSLLVWALTAATGGGLALLGCGSAPAGAPSSTTEITVTVRPEGAGGPVDRWSIACATGSRRPACWRLEATTRAHLARVSPHVACTAIYGGPATATVEGTLRGRRVDARFDLRNGCEIARWRRFAWLIGDPPSAR